MAFDFERESLRMALDSIKERKLRSFLTVLGIVIGISAIIAMVSIGEGTKSSITETLGGLGANTIFITGGGGLDSHATMESLTKKDLSDIQSVRGVGDTVGILLKTLPVTYKDETKRVNFYGVNTKDAEKFFSSLGIAEVEEGRYFKSGERNAVVMGHMMAEKTFNDPIKINDKLKIKDKKTQVVGIITETGNTQYDSMILAPIEDVRDESEEKDQYTIIFAKAENPDRMEEISADIQKEMDDAHGKKAFFVYTTKQLTQQVDAALNTISLVLGGVAAIALLVAGIGIANTMLMSVMERTKEIGIMKAIGASNRNILEIFLVEAALIGLIGGIMGGALGIGLSNVLEVVLENQGLGFSTKVTPELFAEGVGFSIVVGVVFGLLPARKAAKLNPIEALRYE